MPYEVVAASLNAKDKSGRIDVRFGAEMKIVVVSRRALLSVASPPRATEVRLLEYIDMFCDIAASCFCSKATGGDSLLITANDVRRWRHAWQSSEVSAGAEVAYRPLPV
ncbi:hypothetical protein [Rhizobium sp. F40D2]|uniref:hypothetical protein n=1 Tax=Rhizobium sp. F40D2 TaxID=3453141 RepID=UPI003F28AC61